MRVTLNANHALYLPIAIRVVALASISTLLSCHAAHKSPSLAEFSLSRAVEACPTATCRQIKLQRVNGGEECQVNLNHGPIIYTYSGPSKEGFSKLSAEQREELHDTSKRRHSRVLRFAIVGMKMIIFRAANDLCAGGRFQILNDGCNVYYSPTDFDTPQSGITALPGRCDNVSRSRVQHGVAMQSTLSNLQPKLDGA